MIHVYTYVPVLKWKQGEYQALLRLSDSAKDNTVPLIVIPPVGFDFEERKPKKTVDEYLDPFGKRMKIKWGNRPAFIDLCDELLDATMESGIPAVTHIFSDLRSHQTHSVPIVAIKRSKAFRQCIRAVVAEDQNGIGIRANLEDCFEVSFSSDIKSLVADAGVSALDTDFILDLGAPDNYEPYEDFGALITAAISNIPDLESYRSFILISTSFPPDLMKRVAAPGQDIRRHEWAFYRYLMGKLPDGLRRPTYGDYAAEHPNFVDIDMRFVKPFGKLVYLRGDSWHVRKGPNVRDNGHGQYRDHTQALLDAPFFKGEHFSAADKYIVDCANHVVKTGNPTVWKWVGANHHMELMADELASFHGS